MLSQKAKYALRAVLLLAGSESPLTARDIAAREGLPLKFLEAIFVVLRDADIVISRRGRPGGYRLARGAASISFGEVVRAIDGPLAPIRCASRTQYEPCSDCADVETCPIRWSMMKARDAIAGALDGCSLHDALYHTASLNILPTQTRSGGARKHPRRDVSKPGRKR
jgi:Rrf2 family protein